MEPKEALIFTRSSRWWSIDAVLLLWRWRGAVCHNSVSFDCLYNKLTNLKLRFLFCIGSHLLVPYHQQNQKQITLVSFSGKSLMKMMKKWGPCVEPCGTPLVTFCKPGSSLLIFTYSFSSLDKTNLAQLTFIQCRYYEAFVSGRYVVRCQKLSRSQDT